MHRFARAVTALLLAFAGACLAAPQFPALTGRVVDQAGLLSASGREQLEQRLAEHERASGDQVVVVTISSLQGYAIEDYGVQLGRHWGIGQAQRNNGVVLIVAPNERRVRIEVGYGLEGKLTDAVSHAIIQNEILPSFKRGDFETGIVRGTAAVLASLNDAYAAPEGATRIPREKTDDLWMQMIFVVLVLLFLGTRLARFGAAALGGLTAGHFTKIAGAPLLPAIGAGAVVFVLIAVVALRTARRRRWPMNGGWGSGWGGGSGGGNWGGGGGFSGGGGSFGGGGASGRW